MEATVGVAAPVPQAQAPALSAQPLPKENIKPTKEPLHRVTSASSVPNNPSQGVLQQTVSTNQHARTYKPAQAFWQKSNEVTPSYKEKVSPEVQDFLQRAYKTVQRSPQNAIAATYSQTITPVPPSSKISTAIVLDSTQSKWITTPLPSHSTAAGKQAAQSGECISSAQKSLYKSIESIQLKNAPILTTNPSCVSEKISTAMNERLKETGTTSNVGQKGAYAYYNRTAQAEPQGQSFIHNRAVLVAKRKPTAGQLSEADGLKISSTLDKPQATHSAQIPIARSTSVPEKATHAQAALKPTVASQVHWAQATRTSSEKPQSANSVSIPIARSMSAPEKMPIVQAQTSSGPSAGQLPNKKSVLSPKNSPVKHGTSRVAQTYHTYKASQADRIQNGPQTAAQSPKRQKQQGNGRRQFPKIQDDVDPRKRVLVSGFPPYTQPPDLTRVLIAFGNCTVDKCRNRLAVITFDTEESAKKAIKASEELCIYGEFIEIKPFTTPRHVEDMFRAYKKVIATQKGIDVTPPNQIDLTGDFYKQMQNIQNAIRLTREQVQAVTNLYVDLEMVLQQEWPGCVAIPFGSIPTGLGIKSSDADCFVQLPAEARGGRGAGGAGFVQRARRLLGTYPHVFAQLVAIPRANTPIVKFRHVPSGFHCDVSAKTPLGAQNSKLIKLLLGGDDRLASMAVLVKYWARAHELSGTGRLTNYALVMMILFYLQTAKLIPPVELLQRNDVYLVDHWNAGFASRLPPVSPPDARPVHELLGGFFQYYATFDFNGLVVCPFLGKPVSKALFASPQCLPPEFTRYVTNVSENLASPMRHNTAFCVQDPFEQSHNVASSVSARLASDIRAYFKYAAEAYATDKAAGSPAFLRNILLTRPKIRRERLIPTTKIVLIPRIRGDIADPDWRACVRGILLNTIFDNILKIVLKREHEKEEADRKMEEKREAEKLKNERKQAQAKGKPESPKKQRPRVDKEIYSGSTSKPVWRRKKNYSPSAPEQGEVLVHRQRIATEEIIKACSGEVRLEFDLELGFRDEPKCFYMFVRMVDGEMDTFSGFVAFVHTALFDWFSILIRPHLAPPREELRRAAREAKEACSIVFEPLGDGDAEPEPSDPADIGRDLSAMRLAAPTDGSDKPPAGAR